MHLKGLDIVRTEMGVTLLTSLITNWEGVNQHVNIICHSSFSIIMCKIRNYIVACQVGGVSIKPVTRTPAGHTLEPFSPLNRWTIPDIDCFTDLTLCT